MGSLSDCGNKIVQQKLEATASLGRTSGDAWFIFMDCARLWWKIQSMSERIAREYL